jgi:hypothetical protein
VRDRPIVLLVIFVRSGQKGTALPTVGVTPPAGTGIVT